MNYQKELMKYINEMFASKDIDAARAAFDNLSDSLYGTIQKFGVTGRDPVYRLFCPMAKNNRGAYWLQNTKDVQNPYFGSMMFKCGLVDETVYQGRSPEDKADE